MFIGQIWITFWIISADDFFFFAAGRRIAAMIFSAKKSFQSAKIYTQFRNIYICSTTTKLKFILNIKNYHIDIVLVNFKKCITISFLHDK